MKNIVILISGRGSNMRALVESPIPGAQIAAVVSNKADAEGIIWAAQHGLSTQVVLPKQYAQRDDFDEALMNAIDQYQPDLVVLAGYMRILSSTFCLHYADRLINIHPSLLPAFTGLDTHQRALDAGCRVAGCTVHFVTPELDAGPIISQGVVPIQENDTAAALAARVLMVEHQLLVRAVADFVSGSLTTVGNRVKHTPPAISTTAVLLA
jgi:phosphoribosylglycinamide formyltransferase-1